MSWLPTLLQYWLVTAEGLSYVGRTEALVEGSYTVALDKWHTGSIGSKLKSIPVHAAVGTQYQQAANKQNNLFIWRRAGPVERNIWLHSNYIFKVILSKDCLHLPFVYYLKYAHYYILYLPFKYIIFKFFKISLVHSLKWKYYVILAFTFIIYCYIYHLSDIN